MNIGASIERSKKKKIAEVKNLTSYKHNLFFEDTALYKIVQKNVPLFVALFTSFRRQNEIKQE